MAQVQSPVVRNNAQTLMQRRMNLAGAIGYADPNNPNQIQIVDNVNQVPAGCPIVNVTDPNGTIACLEQNPANCASLHPWRQYVDSQYCLLSPETRNALKQRTKIWQFVTFFATVFLTNTTQDFVLSSDNKTTGLLNIKTAQFDAGVTPVIFQVRLGAAEVPVGGILGNFDYFAIEDTNAAFGTVKQIRSALPPQVKNAELWFSANGKQLIKEISCNQFDSLGFGDDRVGTLDMPTPFILPDQQDLVIQLKLPTGSAVPATSTAVRLELVGLAPMANYLNA